MVFLKASSDVCVGPAILGLQPQNYSHVYSVADLSKYKYPVAGSLENALFRNIIVVGNPAGFKGDIYLKGRSAKEYIGEIIFDNVTFFGKPLQESDLRNVHVGKYSADPVYR